MRAKAEIINILRKCPGLSDIPISPAWHDQKKKYPQVTVTQTDSVPGFVADNAVSLRTVTIQIDIWHKSDPWPVADIVENALKASGHSQFSDYEINDEKINRVMIRIALIERT